MLADRCLEPLWRKTAPLDGLPPASSSAQQATSGEGATQESIELQGPAEEGDEDALDDIEGDADEAQGGRNTPKRRTHASLLLTLLTGTLHTLHIAHAI